MTAAQLKIAVGNQLEVEGLRRGIFSSDIFDALTEVQESIFRDYFSAFEETRIVTDILQGLVIRNASLTAVVGGERTKNIYADRYQLPQAFGYYLSGYVNVQQRPNISWTLSSGVRVASGTVLESKRLVRFVKSDDILRVLNDPFSSPKPNEPVTTIDNDHLNVYTNQDFLTTQFYLDYISQPDPINEATNSALPDREHPRLVSLATQLLTQRISITQPDS